MRGFMMRDPHTEDINADVIIWVRLAKMKDAIFLLTKPTDATHLIREWQTCGGRARVAVLFGSNAELSFWPLGYLAFFDRWRLCSR